MGLVYSAIMSLDGYTVDAAGSFDWSAPSEEVHAFVNELERGVGTHLYGRRMYDTMKVWQTFGDADDESAVVRDYAQIWRGLDKVVYSATLDDVSTPRTTLQRSFDAPVVRALVADSDRDVSIGGPTLGASALRAGLVDEIALFVSPVVVGGGTRFLPAGLRVGLDLLYERTFADGVVYSRYRVRH